MRVFPLMVLTILTGCAAGRPAHRVPATSATAPATTHHVESSDATGPAALFSITLPPGWTLAEVEAEVPDVERYREFAVREENGAEAFIITVAVDGPKFVECWCADWSKYEEYERAGIKYANLYMFDGGVRTLKAVGRRYGTDVHLSYNGRDKAILDKVVESIRPL